MTRGRATLALATSLGLVVAACGGSGGGSGGSSAKGDGAHGTVRGVSQQGEDQDGRGGEQGIHVVYDNGSEAGTLARYHVPLPPEHDPRAR